MRSNKNDDNLEVLVDVPITDAEAFAHIVGGEKPIERPIRRTMAEYKSLRNMWRGFFIGTAALWAYATYEVIKNDYGGSITKALEAFGGWSRYAF